MIYKEYAKKEYELGQISADSSRVSLIYAVLLALDIMILPFFLLDIDFKNLPIILFSLIMLLWIFNLFYFERKARYNEVCNYSSYP